jgi:hypothetical protein
MAQTLIISKFRGFVLPGLGSRELISACVPSDVQLRMRSGRVSHNRPLPPDLSSM